MPSGGKSLIIAILTILVVTERPSEIQRVAICFTDEHLKDKDEELYVGVDNMLKDIEVKLVYDRQTQLQMAGPNVLMIQDEADNWWIDKLNPPVEACYTVGFSATSVLGQVSNESDYLTKFLGIRVFANCLDNFEDPESELKVVEDA